MEGHTVRATPALDRVGTRREVPRGTHHDAQLAHPPLRFPGQKRVPFVGPPGRRGRGRTRTDSRVPPCPTERSLVVLEMLRGHRQGPRSSFRSFASEL